MEESLVIPEDAIETPSCFIWTEGDIVMVENKPTSLHTRQDAEENIKVVYDMCNPPKTLLIDMTPIKAMDRTSRELYAKAGNHTRILAIALVTKSKLANIIANFFMSFNKPEAPTRLFSNFSDAKTWLQKQVK